MNEPLVTVESMQTDHREWLATYERWQAETDRWQVEQKLAIGRLAALQQLAREHGRALAAHCESIQKTESQIASHMRQIQRQLTGRPHDPEDVLANQHQLEEKVLLQQHDAHDRIRQHHEAFMAQLAALEQATTSASLA